jgi:hypothetical protein
MAIVLRELPFLFPVKREMAILFSMNRNKNYVCLISKNVKIIYKSFLQILQNYLSFRDI